MLKNILKSCIKSFRVLVGNLREIKYKTSISKLNDGDYFIDYEVPSYTQWESSELVDGILDGTIDTRNDPLYKQSGAKNLEEYEMYSWQICGMACLKMILKSIKADKDYRLIELAKSAEAKGVYRKNNSENIRKNLDGLFHKPFLDFVKNFGLKGFSAYGLGDYFLANLIRNNNFVIASVHPSIREEDTQNNSRNGHLVLVVGFRLEGGLIKGFFINNPSGYYAKSQQKHFVKIQNWRKCFSGFGDVLNIS